MRKTLCLIVLSLCTALPAGASQWGRNLENRNTSSLSARIGSILTLQGSVQETTRPFFDVTGQQRKQAYALDYDLEELGFDGSYLTFGLEFEKMWKYVTLQFSGSYVNPTAHSTVPRDAYIGVGEVEFGGKNYEYMVIQKGEQFDADMQAGLFSARAFFTPFTLEPKDYWIQFVPSIYGGLFAFAGHYEIDAGPARGLTTYEIPPRDYVIGGTGKGWAGVALPEIGAAAELTLGLGERHNRNISLVVQGYYSIFQFEGTTDELNISSRHDKTLDLDYDSYGGRILLEVPLNEAVDLVFGGGYQYMKAHATVEAKDRPVEEILVLREKFDKKIDFEMSTFTAMAGIRF